MLRKLTKIVKREEAGFTLIELMIVILVILILAAILVPQFGLAQERAKKAKCVSNQRNIETAVAMWSTDNPNTTYTEGRMDTTSVPTYANLTGTPQYTLTVAFTEPDDTVVANQAGGASAGIDYWLSAGGATASTTAPSYGHVACRFASATTDGWVGNRNTAQGTSGNTLNHNRGTSVSP